MKTFEIILFYPGTPTSERRPEGAPIFISRHSMADLAIELDNLGAEIRSIIDVTHHLPKDKSYNNTIPAEFLCA